MTTMNLLRFVHVSVSGILCSLFACILIILLPSCQKDHSKDEVVLEITSGLSYGFCVGYCDHQLIFEADQIQFIQKSTRQSDLPDKICTLARDASEWKRLSNLVDDQFFRLDSLYGCPDCVDQGREYFVVRTNLRRHRVEVDPTLKSDIHPLITESRPLRNQMIESKACD